MIISSICSGEDSGATARRLLCFEAGAIDTVCKSMGVPVTLVVNKNDGKPDWPRTSASQGRRSAREVQRAGCDALLQLCGADDASAERAAAGSNGRQVQAVIGALVLYPLQTDANGSATDQPNTSGGGDAQEAEAGLGAMDTVHYAGRAALYSMCQKSPIFRERAECEWAGG